MDKGGKKRFLGNAYSSRTAEEVRDYYDQWAEVYDEELTENSYQQPRRCAMELARHLNDRSARILDVGCGTGLSGIALSEAGYSHIDGCDLSQGMLEKAFKTEIYSKLFMADLNKPPLDAPAGRRDGDGADRVDDGRDAQAVVDGWAGEPFGFALGGGAAGSAGEGGESGGL